MFVSSGERGLCSMPIHNMHMASTSKHGGHGKHSSQHHVNQQNKKSSDNSHNKQTHYKQAGIAAGIIVGVLLIIYLAGVAFFSSHFMPHTTLAGKDVSLQSIDDLANDLNSTVDNFSATVTGDNIQVDFTGEDVGLGIDARAFVSGAHGSENPWAWPIGLFQEHTFDTSFGATVDQERVSELLSEPIANVNANGTDPVDAKVAYDAESASFTVVPETYGTSIDEEACVAYVVSALENLESDIVLDDTCLKQPAKKSDDPTLATGIENANKLLTGDIKLTFNGTEAATVTNEMIGNWVVVADDGTASLDENAVSTWATNELAPKLNTVGTTRTYTRPDGVQLSVSGGTYGWAIDAGALAKALSEQIKQGSNAALEIPTQQTAAVWSGQGAQDWGNTYIDLSIGEQYARFYKDGQLVWESACVTGNTSEGRYTPTGVYAVNSNKGTNQTLIGFDEDGDGEPDYRSHVNFWIPFIDNLIAFHDADWRGSFGGDIYTYNGSHGCVNLPYDKAQALYDLADVGTTVVVHD